MQLYVFVYCICIQHSCLHSISFNFHSFHSIHSWKSISFCGIFMLTCTAIDQLKLYKLMYALHIHSFYNDPKRWYNVIIVKY